MLNHHPQPNQDCGRHNSYGTHSSISSSIMMNYDTDTDTNMNSLQTFSPKRCSPKKMNTSHMQLGRLGRIMKSYPLSLSPSISSSSSCSPLSSPVSVTTNVPLLSLMKEHSLKGKNGTTTGTIRCDRRICIDKSRCNGGGIVKNTILKDNETTILSLSQNTLKHTTMGTLKQEGTDTSSMDKNILSAVAFVPLDDDEQQLVVGYKNEQPPLNDTTDDDDDDTNIEMQHTNRSDTDQHLNQVDHDGGTSFPNPNKVAHGSLKHQHHHHVQFAESIQIQEYSLTIVDETISYCSDGMGISLDWYHTEEYELPFDIVCKDRMKYYHGPKKLSYHERSQLIQQVAPHIYQQWKQEQQAKRLQLQKQKQTRAQHRKQISSWCCRSSLTDKDLTNVTNNFTSCVTTSDTLVLSNNDDDDDDNVTTSDTLVTSNNDDDDDDLGNVISRLRQSWSNTSLLSLPDLILDDSDSDDEVATTTTPNSPLLLSCRTKQMTRSESQRNLNDTLMSCNNMDDEQQS